MAHFNRASFESDSLEKGNDILTYDEEGTVHGAKSLEPLIIDHGTTVVMMTDISNKSSICCIGQYQYQLHCCL